jgi:glycosyltransferase involved in cell wall biosynthesis
VIVAYNALSLRPGVDDGATTYSVNLLHRLTAALPEARIVVYARSGELRLSAVEGLEVEHVDVAGAVGRVLRETFALSGRLRRVGATVLLSPNESLPLRPPCPVVVVAQNLVYHQDGDAPFAGADLVARSVSRAQFAYYRRRMVSAYRRAEAVVAVSAETAHVLAARSELDLGKTTVVHEGSDSVLLPAPRLDRPRQPRLIIVSTLAPYKNHLRALEVFARLRQQIPGLELVVAGGDWRGFGEFVREHARVLGVTESTRFTAAATGDELAELYETSRAMLHLSGCESFGLPVVEAMRYGLPVVAAARSSLPEVAGGAAILVDPDDVDGAADAAALLLLDEDVWAAASAQGRLRAAELSWERTAAGVAEVVRRVSRGGG